MTRWWLVPLGVIGWLGLFVLAYCGSPGVEVDIRFTDDHLELANADEQEPGNPSEPVGSGQLSVVDAEGRLVGIVVARTHRLLDHNELFDAVQVFHPEFELFFTIRMATAEVLRPGKVFFASGNCSGTAAIRALCPDCRSGYQLAFPYHGIWYEVTGGDERIQFQYSSYVAEEPDSQCTGHGNSSTFVYPLTKMDPMKTPGAFQAPLKFVWGS
jgi:hypothetical protein